MYYTGLDPMTGQPVHVARTATERRMQRALLQFFQPENYADVRRALELAGRTDLIGKGPECLIPARAPEPRAEIARPKAGRSRPPRDCTTNTGYRPHRKTAQRRPRR